MFSRHSFSWVILILFLAVYILFPAGSSTTDAWYYAACIKYNSEIFQPHHLLYNALCYLFCLLPSALGADILASLKIMNAIIAVLSLYTVQRILSDLGCDSLKVILISSLSGLSFSVMRYATENETYIVPLFFALLATLKFLRFTTSGNERYIPGIALMITLSVLFHQIYFLWWLGLLAGLMSAKKLRPVAKYFLISLSGPVIYLLIIYLNTGDIHYKTVSTFILGAFNDGAHLGLSGKGLLLSLMSLVRSLIQVHGYMINLFRTSILFTIPGIISAAAIIFALFHLPSMNRVDANRRFVFTIFLIIVLQFVFAIFANGNAEFMVMIPLLAFILVPSLTYNNSKFLTAVLIGFAFWNISYGIIPLHYKSPAPEQFLCGESLKNGNLIIIASDHQLLRNMIYYQTGNIETGNILESPASLALRGKGEGLIHEIIDNAISAGTIIYTDCIGPSAISRATIIQGGFNEKFFRNYEARKIKSWPSSLGERTVYEITGQLQE
jgi:hypothetical protein